MALVNIFHPVGAILLPEVLCDYIESKANVADLLELAYLLALGVAFLPTAPPPPETWTTPLESWPAVFATLAPHAPRHRLRAGRTKRPSPS